MTSALAAAKQEIDRSIAKLEQDLSPNPDFVTLRRLARLAHAAPDETVRQRQLLVRRLGMAPLFQAWETLMRARRLLDGADETPARSSDLNVNGPNASPQAPHALTAIRGLTPQMAAGLQALGVTRFEQIANWTAADVRYVRETLALGRTISQRNWIEQAAVLATRAAVGAGRERQSADVRGGTTPDRAGLPGSPAGSAAGTPVRPPTLGPDGMRQITTAAAAKALTEAAALLARAPMVRTAIGPATNAVRLFDVIGARPLPRPTRAPLACSTRTPAMGQAPLRAEPVRASHAPKTLADEPVTLIQGIDSDMAGTLAAMSEARFDAIASWRAADIVRIAGLLGLSKRRISRECWIEQAAILASGRETAYSRRVRDGELKALCPSPTVHSAAEQTAPLGGRIEVGRCAADRQDATHGQDSTVAIVARAAAFTGRSVVGALPPPGRSTGARAAEADGIYDRVPSRDLQIVRGAKVIEASEAATVEIVSREHPTALPDERRTTGTIERLPATRPTQSRSLTVARDPHPVWRDDRAEVAGGVVRRFLKAVKRDT